MSNSADRITAARHLIRVEDGAYSSRLFGARRQAGVRTRTLGVLRWRRTLDSTLAPIVKRPWAKVDVEIRTALRLGLFEMVLLGVPRPVATDGAVHLIRSLGRSSAAGLVNAVLRRAYERWPDAEGAKNLGIRYSHPGWLVTKWTKEFGATVAESVLSANQSEAPLWVWFLDSEARERLAERGVALQEHPWCPDAWSAPDNARVLVREIENGSAYAQDPSSQLVANLAGSLVEPECRVVDLCAAPGGKAARLARSLRPSSMVVLDLYPKRVRLAQNLLARVGVGACIAAADAVRPPLRSGSMDLTLLDAPCSGTGTLRRHPEIRWRLSQEDLKRTANSQKRLLESGLDLLAVNGVLVYATCSIEPEENEGLLEGIPAQYEIVDLVDRIESTTPMVATDKGGVRLFPSEDGDGFTIHALRRRK